MTSVTTYGGNTIIMVDLLMKETIRLLDEKLVVTPRANRQYEGAIKQVGDTVRVQTFPNVTYSSGTTAGADITESSFTVSSETLQADQLAQLNIPVADLTQITSNLDLMSKLADRISFAMAKVCEQFIIAKAVAAVTACIKFCCDIQIKHPSVHWRWKLSWRSLQVRMMSLCCDTKCSFTYQTISIVWWIQKRTIFVSGCRKNIWIQIYKSMLIHQQKCWQWIGTQLTTAQMTKWTSRSTQGFNHVISELVYKWKSVHRERKNLFIHNQ